MTNDVSTQRVVASLYSPYKDTKLNALNSLSTFEGAISSAVQYLADYAKDPEVKTAAKAKLGITAEA